MEERDTILRTFFQTFLFQIIFISIFYHFYFLDKLILKSFLFALVY